MTKAGLDPSRIQERAEMIAKVQGAKRKRQREEEVAEMDVDEEGDADVGEGDWMDVDEAADAVSHKRVKANSGAVIAKSARGPRSNRQLAGMRDEAVGRSCFSSGTQLILCESFKQASKAVKLRNLGQRERNYHAKAGESDRAIKTKMVGAYSSCYSLLTSNTMQPKHLFSGKRKMGKTNRR